MKKVLIANRGEIALRIARTMAERGLATVTVFSDDDAASRHLRAGDETVAIGKAGAPAYLDVARLIEIAQETGADAVHPGYGFLSEDAKFARACQKAGLTFIGPAPEVLEVFGDKNAARALALAEGVPVARGRKAGLSMEDIAAFMADLGGPIMLKAATGGGGRGMRVVTDPADLPEAFERCRSEALSISGRGDLYAEQLIRAARHIEVQILGDGSGEVRHLFERDCTLQRRHQKLIEIAPSPFIDDDLRGRILADATRLGAATRYRGLGTVEFLVDGQSGEYIFIECNPRIQVEHTITEEITGLDLVGLQVDLASGWRLDQLNLPASQERPSTFALQARVNMEAMQPDARALPTSGVLRIFDLPSGPGIRVDTFGYAGYRTIGSFDNLLAKVIVRGSRDFATTCTRAGHALQDFVIGGVATNVDYLRALLADPNLIAGRIDTTYVERNGPSLHETAARMSATRAPLPAVLAAEDMAGTDAPEGPPGSVALVAPVQGVIVWIEKDTETLHMPSSVVAVLEAMKLEHEVTADSAGRFCANPEISAGGLVQAGQVLGWQIPEALAHTEDEEAKNHDPDAIRPDLAETLARRARLLDAARPDAVARRHKLGKQTARENVAQLFDPGSFTEYGGLTLAMQRGRRSEEELISMSPADGVITGLGLVNAAAVGKEKARCAVMAYDYTVFAGTQGFMAHRKMDRIVQTAERLGVPLVLFAEGGGGRPGDTDYVGVSALEFTTFTHLARLSGQAPLIGIVSGRCFAGNAALLGCCDVIIATRDTSLGMAGPAMIEGGGLGRVGADEVGPVSVQGRNGVIDIVVENEAEAIIAAKRYLAFLQRRNVSGGDAPDQRLLRAMVPENRMVAYDIRKVIGGLCDTHSFLELRCDFGRSVVTGFARIEGRAIGLVANNCRHLGGAIDSPSADKLSRFLELCDAYALPVISLCDTPGFMVGPESEKTAAVRHFARIFVTSSHIRAPILAVILRKAYGLGAQAMVGGNLLAPVATVSWPTGELGPMGIEGAVELAYRRELEAFADPGEREALKRSHIDALYRKGRALNAASYAELDDVIDPAETRAWLRRMLDSLPESRPGRRESGISPW